MSPSGPTVQTLGELEVTDLTPSPFVPLTVAVKPGVPKVALGGRLVMVGGVGVAGRTVNVWAVPEAAA